jgi:hypothetical protein
MSLQSIQEGGKLMEPGSEADINVVLVYTVTIRYRQDLAVVFTFNAERSEFLLTGNLTYIKRQIS